MLYLHLCTSTCFNLSDPPPPATHKKVEYKMCAYVYEDGGGVSYLV